MTDELPQETLERTTLDVVLESKRPVELGDQRRAIVAEVVVRDPDSGEELIRDEVTYRLDERTASQEDVQTYFDLRKAQAVRAVENRDRIDLEALS